MKEDNDDLYDFILSPQYKKVLDEIVRNSNILINPEYSEIIFKFDKGRVEVSGIIPQTIKVLIQTPDSRFINFCVMKIEFFRNQTMKQEFPKGEEVEEFDQKERHLGFSRGILVMYAIEFILGCKGLLNLEEYVKKIRIPSAKKYAKDILKLINSSAVQIKND